METPPTKLWLAVDLDDCMLDFCGNLVNIINTEYGVNLSLDDFKDWELNKVLDPILGEAWWDWFRRRDWLWALAPAVPGAIGTLEKLRREGVYLEVVTAKPEWAEPQTWRWLGKWRPPVNQVTIIDLKTSKAVVSGADALVDDKWDNVVEWVESDSSRIAYLFTRPWNREQQITHPRIIRVFSWDDVYEEIIRRIG